MGKTLSSPQFPTLLRERIIPWALEDALQRMIVVHPRLSAAELPQGVKMTRRKLQGRRVIVKAKRRYNNTRIVSAAWPEEGLEELEFSKLVCVLSGRADFQVGKFLLECDAGNFIFIPPQTPHPDGRHPHLLGDHLHDGACDLLQIVAYRQGIQCIICRSEGAYHAHVQGGNFLVRNERLHRQFELMMDEVFGEEEDHRKVCASQLAAFLLLLHREINAGHYLHPGPHLFSENSMTSGNDFSAELHRYISSHLADQLTLAGVARQMHLSRSQFAVRIREHTGQSFVEYLTGRRIEEACILLRESEWTVMAISEFVGFKSAAYFHRLFKERVGMTPVDFRQNQQRPARTKK